MAASTRSVSALLDDLGLAPRIAEDGVWVAVPSERRGSVAVQIAIGERTLTLRAFIMRAPDLGHHEVYRRLLRKNHEAGMWAFSLDELGDVFLVASRPASSLDGEALDGILGSLSALVGETFEGIVRAGFALPPELPIGGPPNREPSAASDQR